MDEMSDMELTRLCAEAMLRTGVRVVDATFDQRVVTNEDGLYRPLHDDAQAMQLLRWLTQRGEVNINADNLWFFGKGEWEETDFEFDLSTEREPNRAICECVAKMQKARKP